MTLAFTETLHGVSVQRGALTPPEQAALVADLRAVAQVSPPFSPMTGWGKPMSVKITAAGRFCWFSDRKGYRYVEAHPVTGEAFPPIPPLALEVWRRFETRADPDCCLINYYGEGARMGLHQDRDEADFSFPVVSISLGDPALFRIGGVERKSPTKSFWLESGDAMILNEETRLAFHGIDRIKFGQSAILEKGGRLNLTLRRVAGV
ncbi:UNVERIFIED_CONTAM: hypothetical protein GTU68_054019 [Idotea baltica]|nr:hypothetical protein [Idotea baltica]